MDNRFNRIRQQLWRDIWGKDAHRGVTLSYAWLANQFGHAALGGIVALIFYALSGIVIDDIEKRELYGFLGSMGWWLSFEIIMFTTTIRKWRQTSKHPFRPNRSFLLRDLFTDLCYFLIGSIVFYLPHHLDQLWVWYLFIGVMIILFLAFAYWFDIRIHQQEAHLPFSYNLARWPGSMRRETVDQIESFLGEKTELKHILLFGEIGTKKSALAVALGNELVNRKKKSYYMSGNEFLRMLYEGEERLNHYRDGYDLWNWRECDVLIIDHINPGDPVPEDLITAEDMKRHISNTSQGAKNLEALTRQKVIWSVGDSYKGKRAEVTITDWKNMLHNIGIKEQEVLLAQVGDSEAS